MTLEDLYALVEQKYNNCEENGEAYPDDDEVSSGRLEGCMDALQWVMGLIEESHSEEEL